MSFFDDASLVFLGSGQAGKDGKAYSMKPTNGDGDFTFSRGSNLTATRIDSNGLIEKGRENLLINSVWDGVTTDTRPTGWAFQTVSGTGTFDVTATEGQIRFQTLDASSRAFIYSPTIATNGIVVVSVYVDEVTTAIPLNNLLSRSGSATDLLAYEDGVEINYSDNVQAAKRYSVVFNKTASTTFRFGVGTSSGTLGDVVLSKPQIEIGLVATEWITSPVGSTGLAGLLEDSPRFDYSGGASCPSLKLEGSRTNEIGYSEYFEGWTPQGSPTITTNYGTSPEGLQNSSRLVFTSASNYIETSVTNTSGVFTLYAKGTGNLILTDSGANASSTTALTSSYQRIELYFSTNTTTLQIKTDSSGLDAEVYAAQFENATYPTSYIPNHSGGSVTRAADVNTLLNQSGVIGQTAGTILFDAYFDEAEKVNFSISDSTSSNFISIETTSSNEVTAKVEQGGSTQATITTTTSFFAEGDRLKCAISYDSRDMFFYINGTEVGTADTLTIPTCDDVRFGNYDGSIKAKQRVNRVVLFDTRISDNNLATLTS
jgi:hypothetical protein